MLVARTWFVLPDQYLVSKIHALWTEVPVRIGSSSPLSTLQVSDVARVKRFENGFIMDPYVLGPTHRISDVDEIRDKFGYSSIPVTENGRMGGKSPAADLSKEQTWKSRFFSVQYYSVSNCSTRLLGIVTSRDIDFVNDRTARLSEIMTKGSDLVVGYEPTTLQEANKKLQESKVLQPEFRHILE